MINEWIINNMEQLCVSAMNMHKYKHDMSDRPGDTLFFLTFNPKADLIFMQLVLFDIQK